MRKLWQKLCSLEKRIKELEQCEELPGAFKLVTHELPSGGNAGNATLNYDYYTDDDADVAGYAPIIQTGDQLVPYTDDRYVSALVTSEDSFPLLGSAGAFNYYTSGFNWNAPNQTGIKERRLSFEFSEHKCGKLSKVIILGTDVDGATEEYDISEFVGGNWAEHHLNSVPNVGGGIYRASAADQLFALEWDVEQNGIPPKEILSTRTNQSGQSVIVLLADYYVPLKVVRQCDGTFKYFDENGEFTGQIFTQEDYAELPECKTEVEPRFPTAPPNTPQLVTIWAEQNGNIVTNRWNFSWGNGNEHNGANINDWGWVAPYDGVIDVMTIGMRLSNTADTTIAVTINGVASAAQATIVGAQTKVRVKFTNPVSFQAGDTLNFQTISVGGGNDVVPSAALLLNVE